MARQEWQDMDCIPKLAHHGNWLDKKKAAKELEVNREFKETAEALQRAKQEAKHAVRKWKAKTKMCDNTIGPLTQATEDRAAKTKTSLYPDYENADCDVCRKGVEIPCS